jgi:hypothetical protein
MGSGEIKDVRDRKLPEKIDPESLRSQEQGGKGKGPNQQTMNESQADFNHSVEIAGESPVDGSYSGSR